MNQLLAALLLLFCTGCVEHWTNPRVTDEQAQRDFYGCHRDAVLSAPGNDLISTMVGLRMREMCMMSKGYRKQ